MNHTRLFTQGFNNGYLLAKYRPALLATIVKNARSENGYFAGLFSGKAQCEMEDSRGHLNDLSRLREDARGRDPSKSRES